MTIGRMADEITKSEATPEVSHASPAVDKAPTANPTAEQQPPSIDTPQKDVVMSDVPIEQAAVCLVALTTSCSNHITPGAISLTSP